jgi:hypothetical protein
VVQRWVRAGWSGVRIPALAGNLSPHHRVQTGSGPTQPPTHWVPGALSLGVKPPGREADHSYPMPRSRMRGAIPPLPQNAFMVWCSVKKSTFYLFELNLHITQMLWGNTEISTFKGEHVVGVTFVNYTEDCSHVRWVPCHHGMARPQVADGGEVLRVRRVAANILNKQSWKADKG